jgi:hypothetical protein
MIPVTFGVLLFASGCSRKYESRIHIQLADAQVAKPVAPSVQMNEPTTCPPGDLGDTGGASTAPSVHSVKLSWIPSTSSTGPNDRNISYCLYRTKGGRVQESNLAPPNSPCVKCQRVTQQPVPDIQSTDAYVENGVHYCYVVIAIDNRNGKVSIFSNQADAIIPPLQDPPDCNPPKTTSGAPAKSNHHH